MIARHPLRSPSLPLALAALLGAAAPQGLAAQEAAAPSTQLKVAVIDVERVVLESESGKAARAKVEGLRKQKEEEGKALEAEIKDLQKRYNEGRLSLSEDKLRELEKEIEERGIAYRRFQSDAQRDLTKSWEKSLEEINKQVMPIIGQVGEEMGLTLIFNKFQGALLYAANSVDITDQIIERFNAAMAGGEESP